MAIRLLEYIEKDPKILLVMVTTLSEIIIPNVCKWRCLYMITVLNNSLAEGKKLEIILQVVVLIFLVISLSFYFKLRLISTHYLVAVFMIHLLKLKPGILKRMKFILKKQILSFIYSITVKDLTHQIQADYHNLKSLLKMFPTRHKHFVDN